ncbi:hypothetical protein BOTBODRAFT_299988 [Botryobasidium botryosum FD-172 SS1]|uniref:Uncharacterized protein n=1 Tax=Botryobasidium botryosum (strain FD-172 SS1) TaxID=930990 RepID=A0A067MJT4_BOTB1|nr:hypothetical protein BOTBODRAFT_299988 [Botryobasidium botryosum FD-172 SS1]
MSSQIPTFAEFQKLLQQAMEHQFHENNRASEHSTTSQPSFVPPGFSIYPLITTPRLQHMTADHIKVSKREANRQL